MRGEEGGSADRNGPDYLPLPPLIFERGDLGHKGHWEAKQFQGHFLHALTLVHGCHKSF